jgi:hypothetical protein
MAAGELSTNVYTAPQAPDYLAHYAELMRSIPDAGLKMAQAQAQQAQIEKANAEYEFMKQKAKQFTETYPAFKAHQEEMWRLQADKLRREAGLDPYKIQKLQAETDLLRGRAGQYNETGGGGKSPYAGVKRTALPGASTAAAPLFINPLAPAPPKFSMVEGIPQTPPPPPPLESDVKPRPGVIEENPE